MRDQPSAGLHDRTGAAVVGAQRVRGRPGPGRHPAVELEDAARVGLPPAVDELVVVTDHEQPPVRAGEHVHQRELGAVQVLELVDQHVVEARLDERAVARVGEHVRDREVDLVVERLEPGRGLRAGVLRVGGGEGQVEQRRVAQGLDADLDAGRGLERRAHAREALHEGADRVAAAARLELAQRDAGGLHGARHEGAERAAVVVEREARAQHLALVAVAEGVEGGAVDAGRAVVVARRSPPRRRGRREDGASSSGEPRRRVLAMPSAASRSSSCSAALRLKASMRMPDGSAPRSTSSTTRLISVLVLPEPAGARTRAGPRACSTAARCAASSCTASGPLEGRPSRVGSAAVGGRRRESRRRPAQKTRRRSGQEGRPRPAVAARRSRPMSSRSSRAASPTARRRGSSTSAANGRPRQNGRPRATRGWTRRRRISVACASNSSRDPFQYQSPTGTSPPRSGRRGSPGSSVHARREAKRAPGAAAAARCARSRRLVTSKNSRRGPPRSPSAPAAARRVARGEGRGGAVGVEAHGKPTVAALARPDEGDEGGR